MFCRDFKDTVIRVVMRDSRLREAVSFVDPAIMRDSTHLETTWQDPILGVVSLRAAEIFAEASSVTST